MKKISTIISLAVSTATCTYAMNCEQYMNLLVRDKMVNVSINEDEAMRLDYLILPNIDRLFNYFHTQLISKGYGLMLHGANEDIGISRDFFDYLNIGIQTINNFRITLHNSINDYIVRKLNNGGTINDIVSSISAVNFDRIIDSNGIAEINDIKDIVNNHTVNTSIAINQNADILRDIIKSKLNSFTDNHIKTIGELDNKESLFSKDTVYNFIKRERTEELSLTQLTHDSNNVLGFILNDDAFVTNIRDITANHCHLWEKIAKAEGVYAFIHNWKFSKSLIPCNILNIIINDGIDYYRQIKGETPFAKDSIDINAEQLEIAIAHSAMWRTIYNQIEYYDLNATQLRSINTPADKIIQFVYLAHKIIVKLYNCRRGVETTKAQAEVPGLCRNIKILYNELQRGYSFSNIIQYVMHNIEKINLPEGISLRKCIKTRLTKEAWLIKMQTIFQMIADEQLSAEGQASLDKLINKII